MVILVGMEVVGCDCFFSFWKMKRPSDSMTANAIESRPRDDCEEVA